MTGAERRRECVHVGSPVCDQRRQASGLTLCGVRVAFSMRSLHLQLSSTHHAAYLASWLSHSRCCCSRMEDSSSRWVSGRDSCCSSASTGASSHPRLVVSAVCCSGLLGVLFPHLICQAFFFVGEHVPLPLPWVPAPFKSFITQKGLEAQWSTLLIQARFFASAHTQAAKRSELGKPAWLCSVAHRCSLWLSADSPLCCWAWCC